MKSAGAKIIFLFLFAAQLLFAQTPYEVVDPKYEPKNLLVQDFGEMLNAVERNQLEQKLVAYDDSTSVQILVVTFKKLDGYPLELLANEIGEKFGVGQKDKHNGIVIVLSDEDRKVTLRGGYGIQAKMPPTIEKLIIDREMIPEFKNGNYYQGLDNAVNAIQKQLAGQYDAEPKEKDGIGGIITLLSFIFIIVLFIIIASKGGGNGGNRTRRGFDLGDIILMNSGRRSWGGGSWGGSGGGFGGGGFGGFGGGSFGGGGASGSW
jgi:uncharacterized protein